METRIARHHRVFADARYLIPLIGLIGVAAPVGCTWDSLISAAGVPGARFAASVGPTTVRGSYLDAWVDAGGFHYRFLFPNEPICQALLAQPGLHFVWLGTLGRITQADQRCDAVGLLSLRAWRDRQPRYSREPLPRAAASYEIVYRDADLLQLLGRFPLANQLGFTGTQRLIMLLPNEETCRRAASRGTASMEFRVSGPDTLTLISEEERCSALGLAQPLPANPGS